MTSSFPPEFHFRMKLISACKTGNIEILQKEVDGLKKIQGAIRACFIESMVHSHPNNMRFLLSIDSEKEVDNVVLYNSLSAIQLLVQKGNIAYPNDIIKEMLVIIIDHLEPTEALVPDLIRFVNKHQRVWFGETSREMLIPKLTKDPKLAAKAATECATDDTRIFLLLKIIEASPNLDLEPIFEAAMNASCFYNALVLVERGIKHERVGLRKLLLTALARAKPDPNQRAAFFKLLLAFICRGYKPCKKMVIGPQKQPRFSDQDIKMIVEYRFKNNIPLGTCGALQQRVDAYMLKKGIKVAYKPKQKEEEKKASQ